MLAHARLSAYIRFMSSAPTPPYIELHAHSGFSFLDGASHPEELVQRAKELHYPALALTDHNGVYGSMEFARTAKEVGIWPITGAELTVHACEVPGEPDPLLPPPPGGGFHLTLLAETPTGHANLCRLITEAHRLPMGHDHRSSHRGNPSLPLAALLARPEGLILLTGCRRSPLVHALSDAVSTGDTFARRLIEAFGPHHLFVELQNNRAHGDLQRNRMLARLADRLGIPVVATGNVHYHDSRLHRLQDVLVAIRHRTNLDGAHPHRRPNRHFDLAPPNEMAQRFSGREDALQNTLLIAERCRGFDLTADLGYAFPDFRGSHRGGAMQVLSEVTWTALDARYPPEAPARRAEAERRLREELRLVERHGLGGFFLVYRDIMELAKDVALRVRGRAPRATAGLPPGRGRGSSVSSIICHLIGLSHVDPVEADLFLGRFLNEAMGSVPDIDLDFPRDIREALILEVYKKYGHEHTGLVAIFPTYRLRSAVREIGRAMDLPAGDLETLSKLAEHRSATGLRDDLRHMPDFAPKLKTPIWQLFLDRVEEIAGLPRHISQHVGGMIISSRPLVEIVPLEPAAMEGRFLCQWDKDACDDARFIKIDFLALGMLSLVEEAVDRIAVRHGAAPDLSRIDLNDAAVYDRICEGDTVGVFQIESRAQIQMIRRTRPRTLKELAIQVAIVRPGPIVGGAVNPYVRRREALRADPQYAIPYDDPRLADALGETLGVILYQDQVLQVCRDLAGFTDGQAERLRRAMSRKRSGDALRAHREAFLAGAERNGVSQETSARVFEQVVAFSEFGFPKSHAAAFGLLAYQSAWLRHHHPLEYVTALFNNQPMGFYSLDVLGRDARRHGIGILPPDVNASEVDCDPDADLSAVRIGLGFIRGWGREIARRVVAERRTRGPFTSLVDLLRRTPAALGRPALENLIWVGGLDGLGLGRRECLWQVALWLGPDAAQAPATGRADDPQTTLDLDDPDVAQGFADVADADRVLADYRMLRFSTGAHPLSLVRGRLPKGVCSSADLPSRSQNEGVAVAGIVVARQRPQTAKGTLFVLLEDEFGVVNAIVHPKVYEAYRTLFRMEPFLLIRGRLRRDGTTLNVVVTAAESLRVPRIVTPGSVTTGSGDGDSGPPQDSPRTVAEDPFPYLTELRSTTPEAKSWR